MADHDDDGGSWFDWPDWLGGTDDDAPLTDAEVRALTAETARKLTWEQIGALTEDQIRMMSEEAADAIMHKKIPPAQQLVRARIADLILGTDLTTDVLEGDVNPVEGTVITVVGGGVETAAAGAEAVTDAAGSLVGKLAGPIALALAVFFGLRRR